MLVFLVFFVSLMEFFVLLFFVFVIIGICLFIFLIVNLKSVIFFFVESVGDLLVVFVMIKEFVLFFNK